MVRIISNLRLGLLKSISFMLSSLSESLKLTQKQSAAFYAKDNHFLREACTKGLKSGFEPIIDWYQNVYSSSRQLSNSISEDCDEAPSTLNLVMNSLKVGINSKSFVVSEWTIRLLSKMASDFSTFNLQEQSWEWFTSEEPNCLNECLELNSRHPDLFDKIVEMLLIFGKGHLEDLFNTYLRDFYKEEEVYLESLTSFIPFIITKEDAKEEISPFLQDKVDEIISSFQSYPNNIVRAGGCALLVELWVEAEEFIHEEASTALLHMLKYLAR